jgi:AraC-like DNA-binding protein
VDPDFVIHVESHVVSPPTEWEPHTHPAHELLWVRHGTLTARVADQLVTVSEGFGLWIPAGVPHSGRLTARIDLFDAFVAAHRTPAGFASPTVVAMTPLLESLLEHLASPDLPPDARARAEGVVFDVLAPSEHRFALRLPEDSRIAVIAEAILADPADERTLEAWARELRVSPRTITRAFRSTTGLSFARWRQAVRVHRSLTLLADGVPVHEVSAQLGYLHPSTFIDAFRRVMGGTPGAFSPAVVAPSAAAPPARMS